MSDFLVECLYVGVLRLATPFALLRLWWRGRLEPLYRHAWWERLGFYRRATAHRAAEVRLLWVHAVSLGETRAAEALLQALRAQDPALRILLTHSTATGLAAGQKLLCEGDLQAWFPYDTPGAVRRFLAHFRPAAAVLMETEVWPTVCKQCGRQGIPVILANARLSEKSLRQGLRLRRLLGRAASRLKLVLAQTEEDASRLRAMGATAVDVCGNLKYDMTPNPTLLALGHSWRRAGRPVLLAASTREGEEVQLLNAWRARQPAWRTKGLRLLIVPRHPQRFDEIADLVRAEGWSLSRRSAWRDGKPSGDDEQADVWLGDSVGEMPAYYAAASLGLLGGSFEPLGGQNLIEAAACGCPMILGPSTFNFAAAADQAVRDGAAVRCESMDAAVASALDLLVDAPRIEAMSAAGRRLTEVSRGAAGRQAKSILLSLRPVDVRSQGC